MVNECANCGGSLKYDIKSGRLVCEFCKSEFDPGKYSRSTSAEETQSDDRDMEVTLFTCPNCGAEITSTDKAAVEYCLYCGSFVTLESRMSKIRKPGYIIPFRKTAEECRSLYRKHLKNKIYAPKEFRDDSYLSNFKGIFIPYWIYDFNYGPEVTMRGENATRSGDYINKQEFTLKCNVEGKAEVAFDASSSFDDNVSSKIASFDNEEVREFNPSYMFGFFADTADVKPVVYNKEAGIQAKNEIWEAVMEDGSVRGAKPKKPDTAFEFESSFCVQKKIDLAMLPVWFLTWKNGNRVAYSVVNGETGETYAEIPVDPKRYLMFSLLTAVPLFLIFNLFLTLNGKAMIGAAIFISIISLGLYMIEIDEIANRLMHRDDLGYLSLHKEEAEKAKRLIDKSTLKMAADWMKDHALLIVIISFYIMSNFISLIFNLAAMRLIGMMLAAAAFGYVIYRIIRAAAVMNDNTVWLDVIWAIAAMAVSVFVLITRPARDIYYYISAIGCMAAVAVTVVRTVIRYNEMITRPVPHFFDREEGSKE